MSLHGRPAPGPRPHCPGGLGSGPDGGPAGPSAHGMPGPDPGACFAPPSSSRLASAGTYDDADDAEQAIRDDSWCGCGCGAEPGVGRTLCVWPCVGPAATQCLEEQATLRCRWRRRRRRWRRPPARDSVCAVLWWCVSAIGLMLGGRRTAGLAPPPRSYSSSTSCAPPLWILLALLLMVGRSCSSVSAASSVVSPTDKEVTEPATDEKVCPSVDIRNHVENFAKLTDCTVVEGFVHIVLIDNAGADNFTNITFPKLREIYGYLFLYRVNGLRSLSTLFPNLAVIRGQILMTNYALVIYEMENLNDIGLTSLTSIKEGAIRIEKNPVLCYIDTIDWEYIAPNSTGEHFIKGNKNANECPRECPAKCPEPENPVSKNQGLSSHLCWTEQHCQKTCNSTCGRRGCLPNGVCCHEQCFGGCSGPNSSDCLSCQGVRYKGVCVSQCPHLMYMYLGRRCVDDQQCRDLPPPRDDDNIEHDHPWRPFREKCVQECPPGYSEIVKLDNWGSKFITCEKCNGTCEKVCPGSHVSNIARARSLKGCTVIKNSLEIEIRAGRNLVKELDNLQSIREIDGYLKIVRSSPLVSLKFLQNLRVIRGLSLDNGKSLVVVDNENLQQLWNWSSNSTFSIERGRVLFHLNPKLCRREIESLRIKAGLPEFDDHEVPLTSNGDKVACDMGKLYVNISRITANAVLLNWKPFEPPDPRNLLGYVLYITEAPYQNVTVYDGRDACGGDRWSVDDVSVPESKEPIDPPPLVHHILTGLKPYTQYALYVRTYMISSRTANVEGAQSPIIYFRSLPSTPTLPKSLHAVSNSSSEIIVNWEPPYPAHGNITQYIVTAIMEVEEPYRSDYCTDSPTEPRLVDPIIDTPKTIQPPSGEEKTGEDSCSCSSNEDSELRKKEKEDESENEANFEDQLHNMIYIRRSSAVQNLTQNAGKRKKRTPLRRISDEAYYRYKRSLPDFSPIFPNLTKGSAESGPRTAVSYNSANFKQNCTEGGVCFALRREVSGKTTFVLKHLYHFARYSIKVTACREVDEAEEQEAASQNCSPAAFVQQRTLPKPSADNIPSAWIEENNNTRIFKWLSPPNPNGIIVKYHVKIKSESTDTVPQLHCLPQSTTSFSVDDKRPPGNYSIRVSATSLNGPGDFTEKCFFIVPEPSSTSNRTMLYIFLAIILVLVAVALIGCYARKIWCPPQVPAMKLITSINPDYHSATYYPDEWEVPRTSIEILRELGQGSFGMVYEGIIHNCPRSGNPDQPCAIKTVNEHSNDHERIEFLNEASVMKGFKTHHVVRLLGVVSQGQPTLVVMELMARGDLKSYLRKHRPDESDDPDVQPPTLKQILRMAIEIADGMAYLAAKKFVHRDLAARNCMVAEDMTVKIGDFGMTRDIYETEYYRKGSKGLMPVRWMAPESLKDGVFTSSSDVWSYGVVLWEMATLASQPYQGLSNEQVLRYVKEGGVMEAPENCPEQLYDLMRRCWQFKPLNRPSFLKLVEMLLPDAETIPSFNARSFYHSPEAAELRHLPVDLGLAPLEEAEADMELEAISPRTPLRCPRDIEDFDLDGSESETEQQPELTGMSAPALTSYAQYHKAYSSDSSRDSKASNGSSANANTANGYIHDHWHRPGNGATSHTSHPPHSSHHGPPPTLKTTEC